MRRSLTAATAAWTLLGLVGTTAPTQAALSTDGAGADRSTRSDGSYIVVLDNDTAAGREARQHRRRHGAEVAHVYRSALKGYSARMSPAQAARVATDPDVRWVQADRAVRAAAQTLPTGIRRANADASPTASIDGADNRLDVDVAVVDTGIDLDHPDLNVYTPGAQNCSTGKSANDGNGHGTHVAGVIAAVDNSTGVVGMSPGVRLWPVRVLNNSGRGTWSNVICGIDYVTAHADQIEVANMSLGGGGADDGNCGKTNDDAMHAAICRSVAAGVTYAVAAGNDAANASGFVPAAYDEVITVSALADFNGAPGGGAAATCRSDVDDTFADFSNYGADVDLIAPGVCITSTWKGGGYDTLSGTSMASPHVAGGAALYAANNPDASPGQVQAALQAAGGTDWNAADDPDNTKEPLLDVAGF